MNHKRRRPKHQRAGCLMCKPHKDERTAHVERPGVMRTMQDPVAYDDEEDVAVPHWSDPSASCGDPSCGDRCSVYDDPQASR